MFLHGRYSQHAPLFEWENPSWKSPNKETTSHDAAAPLSHHAPTAAAPSDAHALFCAQQHDRHSRTMLSFPNFFFCFYLASLFYLGRVLMLIGNRITASEAIEGEKLVKALALKMNKLII